jgi:hypothetical protein
MVPAILKVLPGDAETLMTADSLQLTAYGPDEDVIRIVEDLPKAKTPHVRADSSRPTADSPRRAACSLLRVTGGSTMLYAWMQAVMSAVAEMERAGFRADRRRAAFKPERS